MIQRMDARHAALAAALLAFAHARPAAADMLATFEDIAPAATNSFRNDAGPSGAFVSDGQAFRNSYSPDFGGIWSGFAVSNRTDNRTPGFMNQYAAITGVGAGGSATYGVGFTFGDTDDPFAPDGSVVDLSPGMSPLSVSVTNTAYAYYTMRDGDPNGFARAFREGDTFTLEVRGLSGAGGTGSVVGSVTTFLADYRGTSRFLLDTWRTLDLSALEGAQSLRFALRSTDNDPVFGMNTPAYFAIDNLRVGGVPVPEPSAWVLAATGLGLVVLRARARPRRRPGNRG